MFFPFEHLHHIETKQKKPTTININMDAALDIQNARLEGEDSVLYSHGNAEELQDILNHYILVIRHGNMNVRLK